LSIVDEILSVGGNVRLGILPVIKGRERDLISATVGPSSPNSA